MHRGFFVFLLLILAMPAGAAPSRPSVRRAPLAVGDLAPDLDAQLVLGPDAIDLNQLRGRVVLLDFWATWCGPCQRMSHWLHALQREERGNGLSVLGVSAEPSAVVAAHVRQSPVSYTVAGDGGLTHRRYGVTGVPMLVLIDRGGKIRRIVRGAEPSQMRALSQDIRALLAHP